MAAKKFYIGERSNPQLSKSYFKAYGQLTKVEAKKKESCLYGSMSLTPYDNETEYKTKLDTLKADGFSVH